MRGRDTPSPGCLSPAAAMCGDCFRYIQPTGAVRDLHVSGAIAPSDRKNTLGGLVGENQGTNHQLFVFRGSQRSGQHRRKSRESTRPRDRSSTVLSPAQSPGSTMWAASPGRTTAPSSSGENSGSINTTEVDAELNLDNWNQEQPQRRGECARVHRYRRHHRIFLRYPAGLYQHWSGGVCPRGITTSAALWGGSPAI